MRVPKVLAASLVAYGAASAGPASSITTYYVNFPPVPTNQAPNSMLTRVILESNGSGWLAGGTFAGENQDWVAVQMTSGLAGGGARALPFEYEVTFEIAAAETTATNLDQAAAHGLDADFDLYAGAVDTASWPASASNPPPYEYRIRISSGEPANGVGRRIHLRTFADPTPTNEGWESVVLRITGVEIVSDDPPPDVQVLVGTSNEVRWLIRDAEPHAPSPGLPPTSSIVMQFTQASPQLAGLSFGESAEHSPGSTTMDRAQPATRFITESEEDWAQGGGSADCHDIAFYTADQLSICSPLSPAGCGEAIGTLAKSACEFDIQFKIDAASTATWPDDFRIYDFLTYKEITPDAAGEFTSTVRLADDGKTPEEHGLCIEAYRNEGTSEAAFEDVIIHMRGAVRRDSCAASPEPESGWSSVAVWIIEDVPTQ